MDSTLPHAPSSPSPADTLNFPGHQAPVSPATQAPATQAPATQAPVTQAPAAQTHAGVSPETAASGMEGSGTDAPATHTPPLCRAGALPEIVARLQLRIDRMQQASVRGGLLNDRSWEASEVATAAEMPALAEVPVETVNARPSVSHLIGFLRAADSQPSAASGELSQAGAADGEQEESKLPAASSGILSPTDLPTSPGPNSGSIPRPDRTGSAAARGWRGFLGRWIPSGCPELDSRLPGGGFRRGALVEWFARESVPEDGADGRHDRVAGSRTVSARQPDASAAPGASGTRRGPIGSRGDFVPCGHGVGQLSLRAAWALCRDAGTLVVLDQTGWFYPPAAAAWGIDLERLVWLRVDAQREAFWAFDQALRCSAVRAVWSCLGRWDAHLDGRWFRRFQLAAEQSQAVGMLVRSPRYRSRPSWAELRLEVSHDPTGARCVPQGGPLRDGPLRNGAPGSGLCSDLDWPAGRTLRVELLQSRGASKAPDADRLS